MNVKNEFQTYQQGILSARKIRNERQGATGCACGKIEGRAFKAYETGCVLKVKK